jgi:hypothetical protein
MPATPIGDVRTRAATKQRFATTTCGRSMRVLVMIGPVQSL